ncbi:ribonucleotide reduction protein [Spiroplasma syrphidicola EA-1]|uniref:Protein NrdI n=2 Tax=Spiroplasma syrphidicola TaxID=216945 RepID=R4U3P1_9MOLU|nr:ribonucleotide reduction protein [Spiroplasma syrphidicola EA-1]
MKNNLKIKQPQGEPYVVYFSSTSNNTHRFVEKLKINNSRIPIDLTTPLLVNKDYILIVPTYAAGGNDCTGAVPKQVINFLNTKENRQYCCGVISSGNTNFGDTYAIAGPIISNKLKVPLLYQFELLGTKTDVQTVQNILKKLWQEGEKYDKEI